MKNAEQFWAVIASYNAASVYLQILLFAAGLAVSVILLLFKNDAARKLMKLYLSAVFFWIGIFFFMVTDGSLMGTFFAGPLFIVIGFLFAFDIVRGRTVFSVPVSRRERIIFGFFLILFLSYPAVSFLLGHRFPATVTWIMPCPLVSLALILFAASVPAVDMKAAALLLIWAFTGLPKAFMFDVHEDLILFASGLYLFAAMFRHRKEIFVRKKLQS